jgi:hypothetical protein
MPSQTPTYVWLEVRKLEASAVDLDKVLGLCRRVLLILDGGCFDGRTGFSLSEGWPHQYLMGPPVCVLQGLLLLTLQFLHFHTKFASPRLPDCSFISCGTASDKADLIKR